jgi:porin
VPQYTGLLEPGPLFANDTFPSEYFLVQSLSKQFSVVLGKINVIYLPDHTLFGDSYKYYFANFNFNENPMATNFYNPTAWAALGVYTPTNWLTIAGGVLDPNSKSDNFADDAFHKVNLYLIPILSYNVGGLPGQFSPSFNWSNKPQLDLKSPFGQLSPEMIPPALAVLVGGASEGSLPTNFKKESWAAIANISQYLLLRDDAATVAKKLKSGQPLRGIGVFGRAGYAPKDTNRIARDASVALFARGLADWRAYDSFGVGFYYNEVSRDLKTDIAQLTANTINLKDEKGIEVFYDFALTPAIRLILSYQHVWDPLAAQVAAREDSADLFLGRIGIAW